MDLGLFGARNVAAALTDFQSAVRHSLISSDCYPLRGDFRLCHGVWPPAHLLGPGAPVSLTPWLLHSLKLISLPHWPIIKSWNSLCWRVEAEKKDSVFDRVTLLAMNLVNILSSSSWSGGFSGCWICRGVAVYWRKQECRLSLCWRLTPSNSSVGQRSEVWSSPLWKSFLKFSNYQVSNHHRSSWSWGFVQSLFTATNKVRDKSSSSLELSTEASPPPACWQENQSGGLLPASWHRPIKSWSCILPPRERRTSLLSNSQWNAEYFSIITSCSETVWSICQSWSSNTPLTQSHHYHTLSVGFHFLSVEKQISSHPHIYDKVFEVSCYPTAS